MSTLALIVWIALGVAVSVLLPVLSGYIRKVFPRTAAPGLPPWVKKYAALFVFSFLTAFVVLAVYERGGGTPITDRFQAFLLGYLWEATLEKLVV